MSAKILFSLVVEQGRLCRPWPRR